MLAVPAHVWAGASLCFRGLERLLARCGVDSARLDLQFLFKLCDSSGEESALKKSTLSSLAKSENSKLTALHTSLLLRFEFLEFLVRVALLLHDDRTKPSEAQREAALPTAGRGIRPAGEASSSKDSRHGHLNTLAPTMRAVLEQLPPPGDCEASPRARAYTAAVLVFPAFARGLEVDESSVAHTESSVTRGRSRVVHEAAPAGAEPDPVCVAVLRLVQSWASQLGEAQVDWRCKEVFRKGPLRDAGVEAALTAAPALRRVFAQRADVSSDAGPYAWSVREWLRFLEDSGLIDSQFARADAAHAAADSVLPVADDFYGRKDACVLRFGDFLEALCRVAQLKSLPTQTELHDVQAQDVLAFKKHLDRNGHTWAEWANLVEADVHRDKGPLTHRVKQLAKLIIETAANPAQTQPRPKPPLRK